MRPVTVRVSVLLAQGSVGVTVAGGAAMAVAALNLEPGAGPCFFLEFTRADGTRRREPLAACAAERFESAVPARPVYRGRGALHFPGSGGAPARREHGGFDAGSWPRAARSTCSATH